MRVDAYDATIDAALDAARRLDLYVIVRVQDLIDRRVVVAGGTIERRRETRQAGVGLHVFSRDGSVGFASTDDLSPAAARAAVSQAGALADAARLMDGERSTAPFSLKNEGRRHLRTDHQHSAEVGEAEQLRGILRAQEAASGALPGLRLRTQHHLVDEEWRVARSDGTDVSFQTPRTSLRHDMSGKMDVAAVWAAASIGGADVASTVSDDALATLTKRSILAARRGKEAAEATAVPRGPCRIVLDHAQAKGLVHESLGHFCESDVDSSVLMSDGRLRLGTRLARPAVSIVDGPLPGDFARQPISANGIERQTVVLVEDGVLAAGLGDLFSAERAGVPITGACRATGFRSRPTPRMTNTRIVVADPAAILCEPEDLTPEIAAETLARLGLLDRRVPTLYLSGYRGGQAHPRRGDFMFAADAVYDLSNGVTPHGPASFSGLAVRALASIVAGVGPLRTDAFGLCSKDGSRVSNSGGSHALLVLDPDPDLVVSGSA